MADVPLLDVLLMGFADRLIQFRKARGLTQQGLADKAEMHVVQIRRYETEASQPSLEAIRKLATALSVSADDLVFEQGERKPDEELALLFEGVSKLDPDEKKLIRDLIEGVMLKHEVKRISPLAGKSG